MDPTRARTLLSDRSQSIRLDSPRPPEPQSDVIVLAEEFVPPPRADSIQREAARWLTDIARW